MATGVSAVLGQPRSRQGGRELVLLVFAAALVTVALVLVDATLNQPLSVDLIYLGVGYLGLFTIAHLAVRRFAPWADPLILPIVALLNGLGLAQIHRLDLGAATRAAELGDAVPAAAAPRQLAWTGFGVALLVATLWLICDHRRLARYAYTCGLAGPEGRPSASLLWAGRPNLLWRLLELGRHTRRAARPAVCEHRHSRLRNRADVGARRPGDTGL
jgi:hypothetical protein